MPTPHPATETKDEFMSKCVPMVMEDGSAESNDQAVAMCSSMWDQATMKSAKSAMRRAYALLEIRSTDNEKRIIEGIANTADVDSYNTILEPEGAVFKLPLPVLYQHNSKQPIGHVIDAKVSNTGIRVKIQIASSGIASFIDEAWSLIKNGLVRGLSVGFDPIEEVFDKSFNGFRFPKWKWLELSTVTIPANTEATMSSVRSADEAILAVLGNLNRSIVRLDSTKTSPGVSGQTKGKRMPKKTIAEQIVDYSNLRAAKQAEMDQLMETASTESRSLAADEGEKYDVLETEVRDIDIHLKRLEKHEASIVSRATTVTSNVNGARTVQQQGQAIRQSEPITVRSMAPKGIFPARMAIAMYRANNNPVVAAEMARRAWPDMPELDITLRAIVEAGDTTTSGWASQLVPGAQQLSSEFLDMYRAKTIMGRIPGLRQVPFNIAVPIRSGAGTFQWVGEAVAKPVTSETFTNVTLTWAKAAAIIVITQELAKFSNPSAEVLIRDSMIETLVRHFDTHFVSTTAAVANVSPAGILNGIGATTVSGTTQAALRADINNVLNNFTANNVPLSGIAILMSDTTAVALSLMITDLGNKLFPDLTPEGGRLLNFPVITSENVGTKMIFAKASDILVAEDPGINVTASDQATIEMETTPAIGEQSPPSTQSVLKSMFQNNCIAIRAEQFKTWKVARTAAIEYINAPAYVPGT